jgi:hypothetical protein
MDAERLGLIEGKTLYIHTTDLCDEKIPNIMNILEKNIENELFLKFLSESGYHISIQYFHGGPLFVSPGRVLGIMKSEELTDWDINDWNKNLLWKESKTDFWVFKFEIDNVQKYWALRNEYLYIISKMTGKKEMTVNFNFDEKKQVGIVECGRWLFMIAPSLFSKEDSDIFHVRYFEETQSIDDLW